MARNPSHFIQGEFHPTNPQKYITARTVGGQTKIIFRSSWELSFMKYCDINENVLEWASEEIEIKYVYSVDGRPHRYYPDFWMKVKTGDGKIKEFIVEIKPHAETLEPQQVLTEKMSDRTKKGIVETYVKNRDKWVAATAYCKAKNMGFKILSEKDILYVKRHTKKIVPTKN